MFCPACLCNDSAADTQEARGSLLKYKTRLDPHLKIFEILWCHVRLQREADLILQPAAVILLISQMLTQFYSLLLGRGRLPLSFSGPVFCCFKQVLPLCNGGIHFPGVLVGLGKFLE